MADISKRLLLLLVYSIATKFYVFLKTSYTGIDLQHDVIHAIYPRSYVLLHLRLSQVGVKLRV